MTQLTHNVYIVFKLRFKIFFFILKVCFTILGKVMPVLISNNIIKASCLFDLDSSVKNAYY
jgi:hypothetical protein